MLRLGLGSLCPVRKRMSRALQSQGYMLCCGPCCGLQSKLHLMLQLIKRPADGLE